MQVTTSKCSATGKTRYSTPGEAKEAIVRIKSKNKIFDYSTKRRIKRRLGKPDQCRHYYCKHCHGFHLTSMDAAPKKKTIEKNFKYRVKKTQGLIKSADEAADWKADGLPFPNP